MGEGQGSSTSVWVTDLRVSTRNVLSPHAREGRARWKMENETFNTLKKYRATTLSTSMGMARKNLCRWCLPQMMMLAF